MRRLSFITIVMALIFYTCNSVYADSLLIDDNIIVIEDSNEAYAQIDLKNMIFQADVKSKELKVFDLSAYDFPIKELSVKNGVNITINLNKLNELSIELFSKLKDDYNKELNIKMKSPVVIAYDGNISDIQESEVSLSFNYNAFTLFDEVHTLKVSYELDDDYINLINDLDDLVEKFKILDYLDYTNTSYKDLESLYGSTNDFLDKLLDFKLILRKDAKSVYEKYKDHFYSLVLSGDYIFSNYYIKDLENNLDIYTQYSQRFLIEKLNAYDDLRIERASQIDLDNYLKDLEDLLNTLDYIINMNEFEEVLFKFKGFDLSIYTDESSDVFTKAYIQLEDIVKLYDPSEKLVVTEIELYEKLDAFIDAYNNLVLKDKKETLEDKKENEVIIEVEDIEKNVSVETGVKVSNAYMYILLSFVLYLVYKRL